MSGIARLNKKLENAFQGKVRATERGGCLFLAGELSDWNDIVRAGSLAVNKKRYHGVVNDIRFTGGTIPPMRLPAVKDDLLEGLRPDVLIIGGGVIGSAIARELSRYKLDILLAEKETDFAMQASGRNDGMVHPGIDLHKGSKKYRYNARGNAMYEEICGQLDVRFRRHGQYLCFDKIWLKPVLYASLLYWRRLGIPGVRVLNRKKLHAAEPNLDPALCLGLFFPTAGSVCPYNLAIAYAENAAENGVRISLDTAVLDMELTDGGRADGGREDGGREPQTTGAKRIRSVLTNRGRLYPRVVINAAGVFADDVAEMAGDRFYSIHPRKGTNAILDSKFSDAIVRTIASSFGTSATKTSHSKGGGIVRTVEDNLLIGPDAQETFEKENFATARESIRETFAKQQKTSRNLKESEIITYFTGMRAATYEEDFVIEKGVFTGNIVHAAGIQSPGLTAAPAIGVEVAALAVALLEEEKPVPKNPAFDPVRRITPRVKDLSLEERNTLIQSNPDYGVILCRCEEVSKGEILDALRRPVPCRSTDGIKRRVRPGMGRCQGGFCGPLVAQVLAEETGLPLEEVNKAGAGSHLLFGPTKGEVPHE
jgi:glycerol-3-phosphate dehydrogenase